MTLAAHALVGAAIAAAVPQHPAFALSAAFLSHFVVDAIPHWDYRLESAFVRPHRGKPLRWGAALGRDAARIGGDALLGVLASGLLFAREGNALLVFGGACAGMFPDALQFAYGRFPRGPLALLQRFHEWIHTRIRIRGAGRGIAWQAAFMAAVALAGSLFSL